jgi:hypothetical protein
MFHLKPTRMHGEIKAHKSLSIHKDRISNIFCKSVHLVYHKLNETKFFLDFSV